VVLSSNAVTQLLDHLCIKLGFCLPPDAYARLSADPPSDIVSFANAVFEAEDMDPSTTSRLYHQVKAEVADAFHRAGG
jgi:hypothetical protein